MASLGKARGWYTQTEHGRVSQGNAATGGGVVRDSRGEFVLGYPLKLTHQDVLQASKVWWCVAIVD